MFPSKPSLFASIGSVLLAISMLWNCDICSGQTGDEFQFPYQALVLNEEATIHSGPGQVHYPTQQMKQGQAVEVHRHDPGGWCAIRPVKESFSLVPESTLELVDVGIGKIIEDGTRAWVGTELGAVDKPLWQVKLQKDELVEVLGKVSWPSPEGHSTTWYQIASPAGEFRWIRMSDIQLPASQSMSEMNQRATTLIRDASAKIQSLDELVSRSPALETTQPPSTYAIAPHSGNLSAIEGLQTSYQSPSGSERESTRSNPAAANRGWRQATRPIKRNLTSNSNDSGFSASSRFDEPISNPGFGRQSFGSDGFESRSSGGPGRSFENGPLRVANADLATPSLAGELNAARAYLNSQRGLPSLKISDLELRLTNEMLKNDPPQWRLDDLEFAANSILRDLIEINERTAAEQFLKKLANCREIQNGYRSNLAATPAWLSFWNASASRRRLRPRLGTELDLRCSRMAQQNGSRRRQQPVDFCAAGCDRKNHPSRLADARIEP